MALTNFGVPNFTASFFLAGSKGGFGVSVSMILIGFIVVLERAFFRVTHVLLQGLR